MDLQTYYRELNREDRKEFADRAGTSPEYIEIHLLPRRKSPRRKMMEALAAATGGKLTYADVVNYFLLSDVA